MSFKPNFLKFQLNFFSQKKDDINIETVINNLDSSDKIFEFFNIYYDNMPEDDIVKLLRFFKNNYDISELSESKEMKTFHRNIFEISENIKEVSNLSLIIDFLIDSLPTDTNTFIIALDKFIQKNFDKLLENDFKILTKYYSSYTTDVEKYYQIVWEILSVSLEKYVENNTFWDVIQILNHFLTVQRIDNKSLTILSKVISDKFKELTQYNLKEESEELTNITKLFYIMRSIQKEILEEKKDVRNISYSEENLSRISKLIEISVEILKASGEVDVESLYEELSIDDKFNKDENDKLLKEYIEREELKRTMNTKRDV